MENVKSIEYVLRKENEELKRRIKELENELSTYKSANRLLKLTLDKVNKND
jgi:cell division septum initiation protein DivIVA